MGISGGSQFTCVIGNISNFKDIKVALQVVQGKSENKSFRIDVDCSWVLYYLHNVKDLVDFLVVLSLQGAIVTPICDGIHRHHTKRITTKRRRVK